MPVSSKRFFIITLTLAAAVFLIFALPNAAASQNMAMIRMFEPDEAGPLPYVLHMIAPQPTLGQTLRAFLFYDYYYYGFPFFALSALVVLPLQWLGKINDLPLVMLALRQWISVFPTLLALLILVYLQDGFRTYRSPLLFLFLVSIPAMLSNTGIPRQNKNPFIYVQLAMNFWEFSLLYHFSSPLATNLRIFFEKFSDFEIYKLKDIVKQNIWHGKQTS